MEAHPPIEIGTDFVGYRIEKLIGRDGMGVVYASPRSPTAWEATG